jgi:hypothetical protein
VLAVALAAATGTAGVATAGAGSGAAGATAATTKGTICVALVVDDRAFGGGVYTDCAKVPKGSTGVDVLDAAGHTVGFRSDGLICTIDGLPKGGCGAVDDSHYWAYFHRAPGATSWTYSTEGPSTYRPVNNSAEGWVYDDGSATVPDNVPQSAICTRTKPSPTPSPTPTRTRGTGGRRPTSTPHQRATSPTPTSTPSPTATTHRHTTRHRHRGTSDSSRHASTQPRARTSPSAGPSTGSTAVALSDTGPPAASGGSHLLGLVLGLLVVAGLGAFAAVRFRRAGRAGP